MKYLSLCICFIMLIVSFSGCGVKRQDEKLKNEWELVEEFDEQIVEEKFQQLITYCKENQNRITVVSEDLLQIVSNLGEKAITMSNYKKVGNSVQNPDYDLLMQTIQLIAPTGAEVEENKVFYFYCSLEKGTYELGVLYVQEDKMDVEEYLKSRYKSIDRIEKITDCIYVTLEEVMQV